MTDQIRIKSPWKQLLLVIIVALPLLIAISFNGKGDQIDLNKPGMVESLKMAQAVSSIAFFFLPAFLFAAFTFRSRQFYHLGFRKAERLNMYVLAFFCVFLAFPFVFWLGQLNQQIPLPAELTQLERETGKQLEVLLKVNSLRDIVVNVIVIALLPAICEEMFFRGALQRVLIQITKSPWLGIILTGILFSALHFQFLGFIPRMFLGIVLGILYWFSGSLWTSILAHFVNNAAQVLAVAYAPKYINENPQLPLLAALTSGIAVWAILWFYQRQSSATLAKFYRSEENYNRFPA